MADVFLVLPPGVCGAVDAVAGTEASRVATQKIVDQLRALVRAWRVRRVVIGGWFCFVLFLTHTHTNTKNRFRL
jgi:hypothetical protein